MMKLENAGRSRNARLNQLSRDIGTLQNILLRVRGTPKHQLIGDGDFWDEARDLVAGLPQLFHEANAYNNVMVGSEVRSDREVLTLTPHQTDSRARHGYPDEDD